MILPHAKLKIELVCADRSDGRRFLEEPFLSYGKKAGDVFLVGLDGKVLLAVPVELKTCAEDTPGYVPIWAIKEARKFNRAPIELKGDVVKVGEMQGPRNPAGNTFPNWEVAMPGERKEKSVCFDVDRLAALAKVFGSSTVNVFFEDTPDAVVKHVLRVEIPGAPEGTVALLMPIDR